MLRKITACLMAGCLVWNGFAVAGQAWAAPKESQKLPAERAIVGLNDDGWAVADVRKIVGTMVVVSPVVGREINLEESNRFALFQGPNVFTKRVDLPLLQMAVPGFISAVFLKRTDGKPAVGIRYRSGARIENRVMPLKDEGEFQRIGAFIEHFDEIRKGAYTLADTSVSAPDAAYPEFTEEPVAFEVRRPRFVVRARVRAQVVLKDGEKALGDLMPVYEGDQLLMETDLDIRRIPVAEIDRLRFMGTPGATAMQSAILSGAGGAATGALTGAFAAWQAGAKVKETAVFAAVIFGVAGFITGLVRGAKSTRGSKTFVLGPVADRK